ncbi:2Fe-2S iron-sulfur cluster-binding protein [Chitinimonas koreensis]|uniref:2Fe-2S iron-sulfur cluster-binding protein n=1 Tax=Chitinimonas koreensis TaxID=356302 RepID=UPI00041B2F1A|nr:2Fe-2S iron-sulfur cluster-binding protein [Chitinimonas koreensis]QNM94767.1 (2Fe-2S)-binding protein [Chitinimonas koreensis]
MSTHRVEFPGSGFAPLELAHGAQLVLAVSALDSPLLFGCRAGLCGTCLVELEAEVTGSIAPPDADEREALEIYAPERPLARLACQVRVTGAMRIRRIG